MTNIIDIETRKPHVVIDCTQAIPGCNNIYVVSLDTIYDWRDGTEPLPQDDILRTIIYDWLIDLEERRAYQT